MKIDYKFMKKVCVAQIQDFEGLGEVSQTQDGIYIHIKSDGAKVLAVAHLDTVLNSKNFQVISKKKDTRVYNMQLDDRLGVYTILDLLPQLGINCDVLLTEGEETGRSTAKYFENGNYNWIFSFDRRGDDVVLYDYQDTDKNAWELALIKSKFQIGIGSFSDIAFMESLGIKGVNIGTGYVGEHTKSCYASMKVLERQLKKFKDFYENNQHIKFPHVENPYISYRHYQDYGFTTYNPYYHKDRFGCFLCEDGYGINPIGNIYLCDDCFPVADVCQVCNQVTLNTEMMDGMCLDCKYESDHMDNVWG